MIALGGAKALNGKDFPSSRQLKWILTIFSSYFFLRLLFFAFKISHFVPPDEVTHFGLVKIFSRVFFLPVNSSETYQYGLVTNIPWLYYWLMGKLLALNVFGMSDLLFLRLVNIPFAFGTVYFSWRLLRLLTDDRLMRLLLVVVMTNTLMFTFLSASISYDNLTNLLAVMAIYYMCAFFKERSGNLLLLSILCQLAGCLTKKTFLPLALILFLILIAREYRAVRGLPASLTGYLKTAGRTGVVLVLMISIGLAMNLQLYGGNLLEYGSVRPVMSDVLPLSAVMQNRLEAKDHIFDMYKQGQITFGEVLEMSSSISHEGERRDLIVLVQNYEWRKYQGEKLLSPLEFVVPWVRRMLGSVFGIIGHILMLNEGVALLPIIALFAIASLAGLRWLRLREENGIPVTLAITASFYAVILIVDNYTGAYKYFESFGVAIQGRYLFPVMSPLVVLFCYYFLRLFGSLKMRLGAFVLASLVFISLDLPFFLFHATPKWFTAVF